MNAETSVLHMEPPMVMSARDLAKECFEFLYNHATKVSFKRGTVILPFLEKQPPLLLCTEGLMVAESPSLVSGAFIPAKFMSIGGNLPVAGGDADVSTWRVRGLSEGCCYAVPSAAINAACAMWPVFGRSYTASLVRDMTGLKLKLVNRSTLPLELDMGILFWSLTHGFPVNEQGDVWVPFLITQELLGAYFGVAREEINRKLKGMELAGYIERSKTGIMLKKALHLALIEAGGAIEIGGFGLSFIDALRNYEKSATPSSGAMNNVAVFKLQA